MSGEGRRWHRRGHGQPMLPGKEPQPYDAIPYGEPYPQKALVLKNNTHRSIRIGQLASDWKNVNFVIESEHTRDKEKYTNVKWLATLYHGDEIELNFIPPDEIKP